MSHEATLHEYFQELNTQTDLAQKALAHKAILQAAVLSFPPAQESLEGHEPIEIGIFTILPVRALIDWESPSGRLKIAKDDLYLDFHIPKREDGVRITNELANEGYREIARYMERNVDITCIAGVTYPLMANSAVQNQNFISEKLDLPESIMHFASALWQNMMPNIKPVRFNEAHIVWQPRDEFINHFNASTK